MKIENVKIKDLNAYERNCRTHSDEQVSQLVASIREFGFTNPVLIDGDNRIIAGHGRMLAASKMGMEAVPCLRLSDLTDDQIRAYVIADNKLAENAGWDKDLLKLEMEDLKLAGFDLDLLGFDSIDIYSLLLAKKSTLKDVKLTAPKMSWVLIGIPLVNYSDISSLVEQISVHEQTTVQTTVTN